MARRCPEVGAASGNPFAWFVFLFDLHLVLLNLSLPENPNLGDVLQFERCGLIIPILVINLQFICSLNELSRPHLVAARS